MNKVRITILSLTFIIGFFYQSHWIYENFYSNPRWVDDAWWNLSYPAYLIIYALVSTLLVETLIRSIKKHLKFFLMARMV
jgi:hypothetical protein